MNLQPPSVLCMGAAGSGKTYAIPTFIPAGVETFVITTEPGGIESLLDSCEANNIDVSRLHWASCLPTAPGWSAIGDMITTIGTMGFEDIAKIKSGVGKSDTRAPARKFLELLSNFKCERTGESYGDISKWDHSRALVIDSLSGWSTIALMLTIGYKPSAHQGEWGIAMNFIENLLLKISSDRQCFLVVTAHIEKEINEISGVNQIMASTLGKKLAPKVPKFFSEVVYAKRVLTGQGDNNVSFTWSTVDRVADLKNRALPISTLLKPDYGPVVHAYNRRLALAAVQSPPAPQEGAKSPVASAPRPSVAPMKPAPAATAKGT